MKYQNRLNLNRLVCFSKREKLSNQSAIFAAQFLGMASEPRQRNDAVRRCGTAAAIVTKIITKRTINWQFVALKDRRHKQRLHSDNDKIELRRGNRYDDNQPNCPWVLVQWFE